MGSLVLEAGGPHIDVRQTPPMDLFDVGQEITLLLAGTHIGPPYPKPLFR
jgi:hypothetical protein